MTRRLLANENFPAPSVRLLRDLGHDVLSVAEEGEALTDNAVLAKASSDQRWIVTFDRDYGELIFARSVPAPPAVILFRLKSYRPDAPGQMLPNCSILVVSSRAISSSSTRVAFADGRCLKKTE